MRDFEIVAHRGAPKEAPENTVRAFQKAIELGATAIELDVRLTLDQIPVIYHYFNLDEMTTSSGGIYQHTLEQLRGIDVICENHPEREKDKIPTLEEIMKQFGGKIGLEIHLQGSEPEAVEIVGAVLNQYRHLWKRVEVTSFEPAMLLAIQKKCPGLATDLLFPRSESWMTPEIVEYQVLHLSRLAHARAIHLHPTQLSKRIVTTLQNQGTEIHAWEINDEQSLDMVTGLGIRRVCTDELEKVLMYHEKNAVKNGKRLD